MKFRISYRTKNSKCLGDYYLYKKHSSHAVSLLGLGLCMGPRLAADYCAPVNTVRLMRDGFLLAISIYRGYFRAPKIPLKERSN
jgi:hypothetical protein